MHSEPIKVLMVEDNAADARLMTESLREGDSEAFRVKHVVRLKEAAAWLATESPPDVVLLDLSLPDASGMETVRRMQGCAPGLPIVVLTGLADERIALEALRCGVQDYLVKGQMAATVAARALRYAIERCRVEKSLMASEERFRLLVEGVNDYAIFMLDPEGRVASWNMGAQRISGYAADDVLGRHFSRFYPPEGAAGGQPGMGGEAQWALQAALAQGRTESEGFRVRKDGTKFWAMTNITALYDANKKHVGFAHIARDLTERNRLEAQLRQAQKMEALGQLTGGIAHDFNNLLTVIIGYGELLLEKLTPADPMFEPMTMIRDAGAQAASLTKQLLAFSRQTMMEPRVLDLNKVVGQSENMLRRLLGEDLELTILPRAGLHRIKMDPSHLTQVLMNLAVNARDAMPRHGKLTIETANVVLEESYAESRSEVEPGRYVLLTMTDTGCGMTPAVKARIFDPFFTTKGVGKGTGLGLSVVHGIIKQSGGHIEVYSEPGLGTAFKIYLPAAGEEAVAAGVAKVAEERGGTETILLVEDDLNLRGMACQALEKVGYTVLTAGDGEEALRVMEGYGGKVDLLATDVVMPRIGGRELAAALRGRYPAMNVLYMSGYTDDAVIRHGILHADVAFLQKPYTPGSLRGKVRQALDQRDGRG